MLHFYFIDLKTNMKLYNFLYISFNFKVKILSIKFKWL